MPVLPFHRYIGPGNDINSGPCVDDDDCIAKKHDIKYENAKTPEDVRLADVEAIEEFRANWMSGNWHSLIGDIGLSLKYCVETYTGVIYPKLGDYEPCEIIPLFHDIIKLHCVNKVKLVRQVDRYKPNAQPFRTERAETTCDLAEVDRGTQFKSVQNFFLVLFTWYQLYHKSQEVNLPRKDLIPTLTYSEIRKLFHDTLRNTKVPVQSSSLVQNCDVFNLNVWIRFFSMIQPTKQKISNQYSDEDLSNMFMLYD